MAVREFLLPDLGEGLEEAEIVAWRVREGDRVELNQPLVEVNTAKALVEIPSPWAGVVERLHAAEGEVIGVGRPLVSIRAEGEEPEVGPGARAAEPGRGPEGTAGGGEPGEAEAEAEGPPRRRAVLVGYGVEEEPPEGTAVAAAPPARAPRRARVRATPPVRRLARELGVDLAAVEGTGPEGRVTRGDVLRAARGAGSPLPGPAPEPGAEPPPTPRPAPQPGTGATIPGEERRIPVRGTRRLVAEKMARSAREIPHVTTFLTVDATHLQAFREELAARSGRRLTPLPIVVRALAEVCRDHPKLTASFDPEASEIVLRGRCDVGIATDTEHGLLAPVVRDVWSLGILSLAEEIDRLVEAARAGRSRPEDLVGSTITVTNVGTFGAEFGTPIINHPEAVILALGLIEPRALVVEGRVEARPAVTLSLSFDHRVMDGAEAGRALRALKDLLENPFRLGALPR